MARTSTATFQKLVEFAEKGGDPSNVGPVIGSTVPTVIQLYMDKLKREKAELFTKFTTKSAPPVTPDTGFVLGDDDDDSSFSLGGDDGDDEDSGFSLGGDPEPLVIPDATPGDPLGSLKRIAEIVKEPDPPELPLGLPKKAKDLFPKIRLRGADGSDTELVVFSENPGKFLILQVKERDLRTVKVKGVPITVDYAELVTNPDGITNGFKNSDLKTFIDLS